MDAELQVYFPENHTWISSINKVVHPNGATNVPAFAYDKSYIIFDYGECQLNLANGEIKIPPKVYIKPPRDHFFTYNKSKESKFFLVVLDVLAFYKLTGKSANKYQKEFLPLTEIFSPDKVQTVYDEIEKCNTAQEAESILNKLFNNKEVLPSGLDNLVNDILDTDGTISLEELVKKNKSSLSTLTRSFKLCLGMTPALFMRLVKFNSLIRKLQANETLSEIIFLYDFFDQTHLTRDFLKFADIKPKEYCGTNFELLHKAFSYQGNRF